MTYRDLSTLSLDWRRDHDYYKVQSYLHDFIGYSRKQQMVDDLSDFLLRSKLEWAYKYGESHYSQEVALVTVTDPESNAILDIGGSIPGDLFVDNIGLAIIAGMLQTPTNTPRPAASIKNTANASKVFDMYGNNTQTFWSTSGTGGSQIQIGSGTTAPARSDVAIQTAFGTSPESALFNTGTGSYTAGSGTTTVSGSITSGGSGTINEALLALEGLDSSNNALVMAIAHDATTATAFTASKSITVQYSLSD